jgi:iron complex transport system substrate-binding protein
MFRSILILKTILCLQLLSVTQLSAKPITVQDIAGRTITIEKPVERIIIGEGRYLSWLGIFERENPVKRVVGMLNDLYHSPFRSALEQKFPGYKNIEIYGEQSAESVSAEKMLSLKPDLAIFGLHDHGPGARNKEMISLLEKAGVKIVFIDFRMNPLKNTLPSLRMLGKVLGREKEGQDYIDYYQSKMDFIKERLKTYKGQKPTAFLQAHPGRFQCCVGMADGMLGPFLDFVGAKNISSHIAPGPTAVHTMEFLLSKNPDIWIGTASGTEKEFNAGKSMILLGPCKI